MLDLVGLFEGGELLFTDFLKLLTREFPQWGQEISVVKSTTLWHLPHLSCQGAVLSASNFCSHSLQ